MRASLGILLLAIGLTGCSTFRDATHANNTASKEITNAEAQYPKVINSTEAPYLMGAEVEAAPPPNPLLSETVTLVSAAPMSMAQIASRISSLTGVPVDVTGVVGSAANGGGLSSSQAARGGLPPPPAAMFAESAASASSSMPSIDLHYHGSLEGLIDIITSQTGLSARFEGGRLIFFRTETRTFIIPALAGNIATSSQIAANSGASTSSSGGSGGSSGSGGSGGSGGSNSSTGQTTITSTSTTDIWSGIEKTAKAVGSGADVIADPSTGTITVTGTPAQLDQVAAWVQSLSDTLSRQVAITIHIYSVKLNREQNYGYSPTLAFQNKANDLGLTATGAPVPTISSSMTPFSFGAQIIGGRFKGTDLVVQALATLGKVSQVFSQSRVTLNGQPASIQVATQTGYLASVQNTSTAQVGSTTSLTPGSVTTGFTGTVTPRVVGNKIYLGMNMVISSLQEIKTVSSGGEDAASIQVPTTNDTVVSQSAVLQSGSILMITGYNEADGNNTHNGVGSPYFPLLGGGADASVGRNMIAIVVTARTL